MILHYLPVSRCSNRWGVAERIWGTLHEFSVRLNRMSTSSVKSALSERHAGRLAEAPPQEPQARSRAVSAALSMHWANSLVHAAFSSTVAATIQKYTLLTATNSDSLVSGSKKRTCGCLEDVLKGNSGDLHNMVIQSPIGILKQYIDDYYYLDRFYVLYD